VLALVRYDTWRQGDAREPLMPYLAKWLTSMMITMWLVDSKQPACWVYSSA